ncbi:IucA/IucC family protein [Streptomyces sp. NPDC002845]
MPHEPGSPTAQRPSPVPAAGAELSAAAELETVRPGLSAPYAAALPGARAAVLTRLWRGLAVEPLPWVARREPGRDGLTLHLADGRALHGPHPDPYATGAYVTEVELDGVPYDQAARLMAALDVPHGAGFAAELDHSTASLALARAARPVGERGRPRALWEWEQTVVDGHPYHPNCRSRPGFSVAEQLAYGPEHGPVVELGLVPVRAEEARMTGGWPEHLRDGDRLLLPVHPWQVAHVLKSTDPEPGPGIPAHPLMALRTLAPADGGPHIKTALTARLTSSVRDISTYSITTAATVSAFLESLVPRLDGLLHITRTLGAATADGPDLAAVLREAPEAYAGAGESVVPVAALATTDLARSSSWMRDFTTLTATVCLRLLDLGVALEAHGQNLLVVLSPTGTPLRLVYRDLADIRISPRRLTRHGLAVPALTGRLITDDPTALRRKLFGSLVTGTLGATSGSSAPLRQALSTAAPDLPRTPDLTALLEEPLPIKALTTMRLTPQRSGDIWTTVGNPLRDGHPV